MVEKEQLAGTDEILRMILIIRNWASTRSYDVKGCNGRHMTTPSGKVAVSTLELLIPHIIPQGEAEIQIGVPVNVSFTLEDDQNGSLMFVSGLELPRLDGIEPAAFEGLQFSLEASVTQFNKKHSECFAKIPIQNGVFTVICSNLTPYGTGTEGIERALEHHKRDSNELFWQIIKGYFTPSMAPKAPIPGISRGHLRLVK